MSSLPIELDFSANPAATPDRMNAAMTYLVARFRALEAIQPEFQSVIDQLKAVGLDRVTDALNPIFDNANAIADQLEAIKETWQSDLTISQVVATTTDAVTEAFADYRNNYLGALASAPTLRPDGTPVVVGCLYFDTTLDQMQVLGGSGWKNAGSSVAGVLNQLAPIAATAGQTAFTIPGGYDVGYLILTVNGVVIPTTDYTATDGATVTLATGLSVGDELAGVAFGAVTLTSVYTKAQVDAGFAAIDAAYTKAASDAKYALATASYTKAASDGRYANLTMSNITDTATARANLGVGASGTHPDAFFVKSDGCPTIHTGTGTPASAAEGDIWVAG